MTLTGKVIEVFIPDENEVILGSNKIGFKVKLDEGEITIIEEQNLYNSKILKGDLVSITKRSISNVEFVDIELCDGDNNE